jgi:hypothetical protein
MIHTPKQGEFTSFATLRAAYIESRRGKHLDMDRYSRDLPWAPEKLHLSDLGMCPRMQMLRILGTEKKYETPGKAANDALMFALGYFVHHLSYAAFDWAGMLIDFEGLVPELPEPWTGHYDALLTDEEAGIEYLWSGKTTRPNAFKSGYRYSFPKGNHRLQDGGYLAHLEGVRGAVIEYIDRGGTNTPLTYWVPRKPVTAEALAFMSRMEECYDLLPELPDMLPRELVPHYRKRNNQDIYDLDWVGEEQSWQCGWCDYLYASQDRKTKEWQIAATSPCKPDMRPPEKVAWHEGKTWKWKNEDVFTWYDAQLKSYTVEADDGE